MASYGQGTDMLYRSQGALCVGIWISVRGERVCRVDSGQGAEKRSRIDGHPYVGDIR